MLYRLCVALGWPHPDFLIEALTTEQLLDWAEFNRREPIGFPIEDQRAAMTMYTFARVMGAKEVTLDMFSLDPLKEERQSEDLSQRLINAFKAIPKKEP